MIHIFESEFHSASPRTPIAQLRIAAPIATEMLAEAAREIDADTAPLAAQAMVRIELAVDIMRRLPASIIDASLDLTLADLTGAVMIGIYDGAYIRRLSTQMTLQISRITSFEDDREWLNKLIDSPAPTLEKPVPAGYDLAAVLGAAAAIRTCAGLLDGGVTDHTGISMALRGIGASLMRASRDLRYAIAAETLMHMHRKGEVSAPRLRLLSQMLIDDADRVTADPGILGTGVLQLGIRALDEILDPPPADPGPPRHARQKAPRKRKLEDIGEDIIDELKAIKSLI
ncbi:hypothetical protein [Gemmobacter sp.]|uniref:hypothetical protein n=1 Tax=Gemmobacter sp. TaxID=1898957 RepID=UPI002AFF420B|nr:hypothetical protein [Gemmobacter sp.]